MTRRALPVIGALLSLWLVLPLVPMAIAAFGRGWRFPDLLPRAASLAGWQAALAPRSGLVEALATTLAIAALATLGATLIGLPAGAALGRRRFRGRGLVLALVTAPLIVPAIAVAPGLHEAFIRAGLTNTIGAVALAHLIPTIPYMTLIMTAAFARLDPDLAAQARTLGASPAQAFRHVTLPALRPSLLAGALFVFLVSWGQYLLTLMIGGGRVMTLPLLLNAFAASGRTDIAGAVALVTILPGALVALLAARAIAGAHDALTPPR